MDSIELDRIFSDFMKEAEKELMQIRDGSKLVRIENGIRMIIRLRNNVIWQKGVFMIIMRVFNMLIIL